MEDAELDPLRERFRRIRADSGRRPRQVDAEEDVDVDMEGGKYAPSPGTPESDSGPKPDSPSPRVLSDKHPYLESSFDKVRLLGGSCVMSVRNDLFDWSNGRQS